MLKLKSDFDAQASFQAVQDDFKALVECLDDMSVAHQEARSPPEVIAHLHRAKSLARRGADIARQIPTLPN